MQSKLQPMCRFAHCWRNPSDIGFHITDNDRRDQCNLSKDHDLNCEQKLEMAERPHARKEHIKH